MSRSAFEDIAKLQRQLEEAREVGDYLQKTVDRMNRGAALVQMDHEKERGILRAEVDKLRIQVLNLATELQTSKREVMHWQTTAENLDHQLRALAEQLRLTQKGAANDNGAGRH